MAACAVLIVEDDALLRGVLADGLSSEGFDVRSAANGRDALSLLGYWRPDVIILDLAMPYMDGRLFRAEQRRRADLAAIPVIVVSANVNREAEIAELEAAASLPKPCDPELLKTVIQRVLGGGHLGC